MVGVSRIGDYRDTNGDRLTVLCCRRVAVGGLLSELFVPDDFPRAGERCSWSTTYIKLNFDY